MPARWRRPVCSCCPARPAAQSYLPSDVKASVSQGQHESWQLLCGRLRPPNDMPWIPGLPAHQACRQKPLTKLADERICGQSNPTLNP
jgi:hypothetical protein